MPSVACNDIGECHMCSAVALGLWENASEIKSIYLAHGNMLRLFSEAEIYSCNSKTEVSKSRLMNLP